MDRFVYQGNRTKEISFPLGGIGTGCIGLAGNGRLIDWEIFNKPSKGSFNGFSHFAIKAQRGGKVLDARILNGDLCPPYTGQFGAGDYQSFGFGPPRTTMAGLPHFRGVAFRGQFPIATLSFKDRAFPGSVRLTAFNPFIPLDDKDSGIPAAFFEIEVRNTTSATIAYTLAGTLANPLPANNLNSVSSEGPAHFLHLKTDGLGPQDVKCGDLTLATDAGEVSWQEYWYRGGWFDNLDVFWRDFTSPGAFQNRSYEAASAAAGNHGTLAAHVTLKPGRSQRVRFVIAWNFPNCENYWSPKACQCAKEAGLPLTWKNYYATLWADSRASASYCLANWDRLYGLTAAFKEALFASDLPDAALEAVSATMSVLKTATVMRLEDGTFYGWEGCHPSLGCCEGSCQHVWNYAQALPFLFPKLERSMREADYKYNLRPDGGVPFRIQLPLGTKRSEVRPCADGQFGGVMKAYRDWKICGDSQWLRKLWPAIKASIEFAWHGGNIDRWDPDKTGVLWGRQHHTLDMELFGPNSWLTGFYLGALKAGAEMAEHLGEPQTAAEFRGLFQKGKAWVEANLFNGQYYRQMIDLGDKSVADRFDAAAYWSQEHKQLKYQIADGCNIDQVLAQGHANLYGLGELFDPRQVRKALASIFKYNFKKPMRDFANTWRLYCLNDEAGLVICTYPPGRDKPAIPLTYWPEAMNGFEYAAAAQMIQSGLVKEGAAVVAAVRDRYDGEKRNPWNEFECGSNYARSMASYSLLNAFSGLQFDMVKGMIGFEPVAAKAGKFQCFWSLEGGWGVFSMKPARARIQVLYGALKLKSVKLPFVPASVSLGDRPIDFRVENGQIVFDELCVDPSEALHFAAAAKARKGKKPRRAHARRRK